MSYYHEILTVSHNQVVIGYMTRRQVLYPWGDMVENGSWYVTRCIRHPNWLGKHGSMYDVSGFKTRREARLFLMGKK